MSYKDFKVYLSEFVKVDTKFSSLENFANFVKKLLTTK